MLTERAVPEDTDILVPERRRPRGGCRPRPADLLRIPARGLTNVRFGLTAGLIHLHRARADDRTAILLSEAVHNAGPDPRDAAARFSRLHVLRPALDAAVERDPGTPRAARDARRGPTGDADVIVIDGPLSSRQHRGAAVGFVKTHQVAYLPPELDHVVAQLAGGQRTPMFLTSGQGSGYSRLSFYLRLVNERPHPWHGIVRCELPPDQPITEAIAALERDLRHRLGDANVLQQTLRRAV